AAGEDLRHDRLLGLGVHLYVAPPLHAKLRELLREPARLRRLAEREKNGVAGDLELRTRDRDGAAPSLLVGVAELVADEDDATHVAVRIGEDLHGGGKEDEPKASGPGSGDLSSFTNHLPP